MSGDSIILKMLVNTEDDLFNVEADAKELYPCSGWERFKCEKGNTY